MKKLLLFLLVIAATTLSLQFPAAVSAAGKKVTIKGHIMDGSTPVIGADVTITVNGKLFKKIKTDDKGNFNVETDDTSVPAGATVDIGIDVNGDGKPESWFEGQAKEVVSIEVNLHPIDAPEYGLWSGIVAIAAGASLILLRRRLSLSR